MASQTITKTQGQDVLITNYQCLDNQTPPQPAQAITISLVVVGGNPGDIFLFFDPGFTVPSRIRTVNPGTFQISLRAENSSGAIVTNAAGDIDETDTLVVNSSAPPPLPPPASQSYQLA